MEETIGVVICNYNKEQDVLSCIQSVLESKYEDYHIYVVDNASTDRSVQLIRQEYGDNPKVTLLVNSENLGGSGGFNTGLRKAIEKGHPYLMCIDNDAMIDENCLGELLLFLDEHEDVGIAAAKIYNTGMEDYVQQYGSFIDFDNYVVNSTYYNHMEDGSMPDYVFSDAVPACALMIKRSVVDIIGIMPEENFLYWDDTEWCYRCTQAGYKVASVGSAAACHAMGAKREDVNTFPTYYAWRNWIVFFLQHLPEDKLETMAEGFLSTIFDIVYSCLYRGESNRSDTVMAALDDALHGVMGKAGPNRIFDLEFTYKGLGRAVAGKNRILLIENEYPLYAQQVKSKIEEINPQAEVRIFNANESGAKSPEAIMEDFRPEGIISLCESIFDQEDLSLCTYIMDLDGNVLIDEDEAMMCINYPFAKRSFIFAQKALFVRTAKELRTRK